MKPFWRLIPLVFLPLFTACASPTPTPIKTADLFTDDFSQDAGNWETFADENGAAAAIADGKLALTITRASTVGFSVAAINLANFDLTITTAQISGGLANGYGIIFRYIDEENFYRFDISGDGLWGVSRRLKDQWLPIAELTASPAIQTGHAANTLRLVARSDQFEFYVNGVLLGQLTDANLPVGRIGLFASTFDDPNTQVAFDDLKIVNP
ncbi:MAG: hypothetical protein HYZ49_08820 [Chloroflexi bacterium]|nr:hypothetical protein [Chloroflexota bacterium]